MAWSIRCRGPSGQTTLSGLDPSISVHDFLQLLAERSGVAFGQQEILAGFPPKPLAVPVDLSSLLSSLPLANGDTITVRQAAQQAPLAAATAAVLQATPAATAVDAVQPLTNSSVAAAEGPVRSVASQQAYDEDAALARALAASMADVPIPYGNVHAPASASATARPAQTVQVPARPTPTAQSSLQTTASPALGTGGKAPTSVSLVDGSAVVRRIIDSDNSCLFNAVGYVMEHSRAKSYELRQVIAKVVREDPVTYNEGFLGQENDAYCRWILDKKHWGGAIELSILARHYGREIAAFDIQTTRCDVYGQDAGYGERAMLLYDGLHYDAMAVAAFEGAPEDLDITIVSTSSAEAGPIEAAAKKLVAGCHAARQFTNTATFTLRCGACQIGLKGEKEAVEHAKATGHSNFTEY